MGGALGGGRAGGLFPPPAPPPLPPRDRGTPLCSPPEEVFHPVGVVLLLSLLPAEEVDNEVGSFKFAGNLRPAGRLNPPGFARFGS